MKEKEFKPILVELRAKQGLLTFGVNVSFTLEGFSLKDLEDIRQTANETGVVNIRGCHESSKTEILEIYPEIERKAEFNQLKYQCLVMRTICEICNKEIAYLKENELNEMTHKYYEMRKFASMAKQHLSKRIDILDNTHEGAE